MESTAKDGNARIERPAIYDNHDLSSQTPPVSVDLSIGTTQYEIDTYATNALGSDSDEQEYALLITRTPQVNLERPALNGQPYIVFTGTFTGSFFGEQLGQYPVQRFDPQYYQHYFFGFLTLNDIVCTATEVSGLPSLENVPLENIHLTMSNRFLDYDNTYYYYNGDFSDWFWHEEWVGTQDPELTLKVNENVLLSSNHLVNVADSELNPTPGWIESWFITSYAEEI